MKYRYRPQGVCSSEMLIELDDNGIVMHVEVIGGCHGNLQGLAKLMEGRPASEIADRLAGIHCGAKQTSCPDQMSVALKKIIASREQQ